MRSGIVLMACTAMLAPLGFGRSGGVHVATFIPGCEVLPPRITTTWLVDDHPPPREPRAPIGIYLAGNTPPQTYEVIGTVEVEARNRRTSIQNLMQYAGREARRMGGEALVEITPARVDEPSRGARVRRLTAQVAIWRGSAPAVARPAFPPADMMPVSPGPQTAAGAH